MKPSYYIEKLLQFGLKHKMLEPLDIVQVRNQLMEILKVEEPYEGNIEEDNIDSPIPILEKLLDYAVEIGIIENNITERDILDAKLMAQLMPRQSELYRKFKEIEADKGIKAATDFYYNLSKNSNYIRMDRVSKNEYWTVNTEYGTLEITINLSKPEKDPKEIEKAKSMPQGKYPKCFLCVENVGYKGRFNHPARSNHRVIPITINNEQFYFQYSPYVYYNEHSIVFKAEHEPMSISKKTFRRLFDFVEQIPHYFLGSNADLPIVGGSILSHEHYQGGHHTFCMELAPTLKTYKNKNYENVKIDIIKWPLSVIRLTSKDKENIVELAGEILQAWRDYSDESVNIKAYSQEKGKKIPHNTITPIARINKEGQFELDLTLRNNRRSKEYPDGIFHPYRQYHHIKKENIGLIEVMGLAVLPARLKNELKEIKLILTGNKKLEQKSNIIDKHKDWINDLVNKYGTNMEEDAAEKLLKEEVGNIFKKVLECSGVFKQNKEGLEAFERFILKLGCKPI